MDMRARVLLAALAVSPISDAYAQAPSLAGERAFEHLLACRQRYPVAEPPTLFWRCAKAVLVTSGGLDKRRVAEAITFGDYSVTLLLKGLATDQEVNRQLADILSRAID
jgi:hypothetical protein